MKNSSPDRQQLLAEARTRIHAPHDLDASASLALQNLQFGVARALHVVRKWDRYGTVSFHTSLDFTITRSPERWASGFAYGGLLHVQCDARSLVFPEVRPNTCGTCVGRIDLTLSPDELVERIYEARGSCPPGEWDYGRKNHFINVYKSKHASNGVFIIHGCPNRHKADGTQGPGLYIERSPRWQDVATTEESPIGRVSVLYDEHARDYWTRYQACESETKEERSRIAKQIFGDYSPISNETHEGMLSIDTYVQGCHAATDSDTVFPIMTQIGKPAFLVTAKIPRLVTLPNGVIALVPHGTGYDLSLSTTNLDVRILDDGNPLFVLTHEGRTEIFQNFAHVPFGHRTADVAAAWVRDGKFQVEDELQPYIFTKF